MKLDLDLDLFFTVLTLATAIPAWVQIVIRTNNRQRLLLPVALVTGSVLTAVLFENLITFGSLTLDYSLRFAAAGIPMSVLGMILARKRYIGSQALGVQISLGASLFVWWLLITLH